MQKLRKYMNMTVRKCVQNTMLIHLSDYYKKITEINLLKQLKHVEINQLSAQKSEVQQSLESIEVSCTDHLRHNRLPLVKAITAIDEEIESIEAMLQTLEQEKQQVQLQIIMLSKLGLR